MIRRSGALGAVALLLCVACSNDAKTPSASKTPRASITTTTTATTATATGPAKPSTGCGTATGPAPPVTKEKRTLPVDGTDREFLLTVPARPAAAKPMPLIIDFHGLAEGDQIHSQMTEFGTLGLKDGFVVLTPQGLGALAHWEIDPKLTPNPDLDFVTQMIDRTERDFCIDSSRVYATGLSYGAFMSSSLACRMADRFAAVAPVSGLQCPIPASRTGECPSSPSTGRVIPS